MRIPPHRVVSVRVVLIGTAKAIRVTCTSNNLSSRDDNDVVNDPAVKSLVLDQTNQWSEMVERHRREEWQLLRSHLQAQEDVLRKLMEQQQLQQMKELEMMFEK